MVRPGVIPIHGVILSDGVPVLDAGVEGPLFSELATIGVPFGKLRAGFRLRARPCGRSAQDDTHPPPPTGSLESWS